VRRRSSLLARTFWEKRTVLGPAAIQGELSMITCTKVETWDGAIKHLRRDVFANQCLLESLERNSPPVPRDVWVAQRPQDQIVGAMVVEEMGDVPCAALRVVDPEAVPALLRSLEQGRKYLYTIGMGFLNHLLPCVSEPTDRIEIVSLTLSTEDFVPFRGAGDVRRLRLADSSLTDQFPPPPGGEPPLSRFVEWAEDGADSQMVFGLLAEGSILSFVQFGTLLDDLWEVGMIRTREDHIRKGFAKAVLSEASKQLLEDGKTPFYQVRRVNTASLRTAATIGYREVFCLFSCSGRLAVGSGASS